MPRRYSLNARALAAQRGFSMIELLIVLLILSVITAAIFKQIDQVQQRSATEQSKLDMFQESREFMDQISRDLRQAGYPNVRNFDANVSGVLFADPSRPTSPYYQAANAAVGLVKVDSGDLWFEGDVDGTGQVSEVVYHLDTSTTNNCPCLRRSKVTKIQADPVTGQTTPVYQVEVQNVQNGSSTSPIFYAYPHASGGVAATLPIDFDSNASTIASIDTVKIVLTVQAKNPDPKTGKYPVTTLVSTVRLNNCSSATTGQNMSCQ